MTSTLIPILPRTFLFVFVPKSTPTLPSFFHFSFVLTSFVYPLIVVILYAITIMKVKLCLGSVRTQLRAVSWVTKCCIFIVEVAKITGRFLRSPFAFCLRFCFAWERSSPSVHSRMEADSSFPLKDIASVVEVFKVELAKIEPNLAKLSIILGFFETALTCKGSSNSCSSLDKETFDALGGKFQALVQKDLNTNKEQKPATRDFVVDVADLVWSCLSKSYFKDKPHIQNLYSFLTGKFHYSICYNLLQTSLWMTMKHGLITAILCELNIFLFPFLVSSVFQPSVIFKLLTFSSMNNKIIILSAFYYLLGFFWIFTKSKLNHLFLSNHKTSTLFSCSLFWSVFRQIIL